MFICAIRYSAASFSGTAMAATTFLTLAAVSSVSSICRGRATAAGGSARPAVHELGDQRAGGQRIVRSAAERGADLFGDHLAGIERHPHLGAERHFVGGAGIGVWRGVDASHQRPHGRVVMCIALEILEPDLTLQGSRGRGSIER
jgi:hypothetical protein